MGLYDKEEYEQILYKLQEATRFTPEPTIVKVSSKNGASIQEHHYKVSNIITSTTN